MTDNIYSNGRGLSYPYMWINGVCLPREDKLVYGRKQILSYKNYNLITPTETGTEVNTERVSYLYKLFLYNLKALTDAGIFKVNYLYPHELLCDTKGIYWDWTNELEFDNMIICTTHSHGFYFPIFTLPKGITHKQDYIPDNMENLYSIYDGNHRIDVAQYIESYGGNNADIFLTSIFGSNKLLTIEIPVFCEEACDEFKYSLLKYDINGPLNMPSEWLFKEPVKLFYLRYCADEMNIDILNYEKECWDTTLCRGVDLIEVRDYQLAYRILQMFQNVLEYPLTYYYDIEKELPREILADMQVVNNPDSWKAFKYKNIFKESCPCCESLNCMIDNLIKPYCKTQLCCKACDFKDTCETKCRFCK